MANFLRKLQLWPRVKPPLGNLAFSPLKHVGPSSGYIVGENRHTNKDFGFGFIKFHKHPTGQRPRKVERQKKFKIEKKGTS